MENTDVGVQDFLYNQEEVFNNRELLQTGFRFSSFPLNMMATDRKEAAVAVEMNEKEAKNADEEAKKVEKAKAIESSNARKSSRSIEILMIVKFYWMTKFGIK